LAEPPPHRTPIARRVRPWPWHWWTHRSLRLRLTIVATAIFSLAVATGALLLILLQGYSLTRVLDQTADKSAVAIASQWANGNGPNPVQPISGVTTVQVVNGSNDPVSSSPGGEGVTPILTNAQLARARGGEHFNITNTAAPLEGHFRVLARPAGTYTVVVLTDLNRVEDSQRLLVRTSVIGGPIAVAILALATYVLCALSLRPVAALRHGAEDITAAGLADQRLPVPSAQDEIHSLAITLNDMLDRIDSATTRQRTFVGDAAHELRSPLASLRVQLEVAQRLGPAADWEGLLDDVMIDVQRLDRLVGDLLALARLDEAGVTSTSEQVDLGELVRTVVGGYGHARVPVTVSGPASLGVPGDRDRLHRVLINLVDNAVRHANSRVEVTLEPVANGSQKAARLAIIDDGRGIPAAELERVFDRFYRLEEARDSETGGTGLGLAIVRDIVRAHGGTVRLEPKPDGAPGLQAVVLLPARGRA